MHGTLSPPQLPKVPIADVLGAERAVSTALCALHRRDTTGAGGRYRVALEKAAARAGDAVRYGLLGDGAPLGGAFPGYGIYECADGFVALGAIEPHFYARTLSALECEGTHASLARRSPSRHRRTGSPRRAGRYPLNGVK